MIVQYPLLVGQGYTHTHTRNVNHTAQDRGSGMDIADFLNPLEKQGQ